MSFLANLAQKGLQGSAQALMPPSDGWGSLHHGNRPCNLLFCGSCLNILKKLKKQGQLGKQGFHILNLLAGSQEDSTPQWSSSKTHVSCGLVREAVLQSQPLWMTRAEWRGQQL